VIATPKSTFAPLLLATPETVASGCPVCFTPVYEAETPFKVDDPEAFIVTVLDPVAGFIK
jgi:hypothetical protein